MEAKSQNQKLVVVNSFHNYQRKQQSNVVKQSCNVVINRLYYSLTGSNDSKKNSKKVFIR